MILFQMKYPETVARMSTERSGANSGFKYCREFFMLWVDCFFGDGFFDRILDRNLLVRNFDFFRF